MLLVFLLCSLLIVSAKNSVHQACCIEKDAKVNIIIILHLSQPSSLVNMPHLPHSFAVTVSLFPNNIFFNGSIYLSFSGMLTLKDLVNTIAAKLQEHVLEGSELYGRKNNRIYPCKVVKVLKDSDKKTQYQVAWLDKDKKITSNAVVVGEDLIRKKLPFTREVLKSFIRESTYRSVPWVLHDKLALMHGISTDPPEELKGKVFLQDGLLVNNKKRKKSGVSY